MRDIIANLYKSPIIKDVEIIEIIEEPEIQLLYARVTLTDKSLLYIREVFTPEDDKYSYHWQTEHGRLIRRWDNAPHWQKQIGVIHHVHIRKLDIVKPSNRVTVEEVLETVSEIIEYHR